MNNNFFSSEEIDDEISKSKEFLARIEREREFTKIRYDLLPIDPDSKDPAKREEFYAGLSANNKAKYDQLVLKIQDQLELYAPIKHIQLRREQLYQEIIKGKKFNANGSLMNQKQVSNSCSSPSTPKNASQSVKNEFLNYKNIHYVVR